MDRKLSQTSFRNLARLHLAFQRVNVGLDSPIQAPLGSTMAPEESRMPSFKQMVLTPPAPSTDPPKQAQRESVWHESRSALIRRRFEELRRRSTTTNPVCFKCGDRGHQSVECRNAWLCLVCNKHGHRSVGCSERRNASSSTPLSTVPSTSGGFPAPSSQMASIRNPILLFNSTPESEIVLQDFKKSFILSDTAKWGVD